MISSSLFYSALCLVLCVTLCESFTPLSPNAQSSSTTALDYQSEMPIGETTILEKPLPVRKNTIPKPSKHAKIIVEDITSLNELKWFLEEDERPVVIK